MLTTGRLISKFTLVIRCLISHFISAFLNVDPAWQPPSNLLVNSQQAQNGTEESNAFDQRRTDNHRGLNLIGRLRLARNRRHGFTRDPTDSQTCSDHNKGRSYGG